MNSVLTFLSTCVSVVSKRGRLLVMLNWLFFGVMLVGAFLGQAGFVGRYEWPVKRDFFFIETTSIPWMILAIFLLNLVVSGFVLVTLSGLVFFALPVAVLLYRALLWGVLLTDVPTPLFLAAFPTLIFEGEGYVFGSLAGVNLGLSWLNPELVYKGEELGRLEAIKRAMKDCIYIYILVAILLFAAAVVETVTIGWTGGF